MRLLHSPGGHQVGSRGLTVPTDAALGVCSTEEVPEIPRLRPPPQVLSTGRALKTPTPGGRERSAGSYSEDTKLQAEPLSPCSLYLIAAKPEESSAGREKGQGCAEHQPESPHLLDAQQTAGGEG